MEVVKRFTHFLRTSLTTIAKPLPYTASMAFNKSS